MFYVFFYLQINVFNIYDKDTLCQILSVIARGR